MAPWKFPFRMSGYHRTQQSPSAWSSGSESDHLQRGNTACCPPADADCPRAVPGSVLVVMLSRVGWDCLRVLLWRSPGHPGMSPCQWAPRRCPSCCRCRFPRSRSAYAASGTSHALKTGWCSWGHASPSLCFLWRWWAGGTSPASGGVGDDDVEGVGGCDFALLATHPLLSSAPAGAPCSSWTSCASYGWMGPSAEPLFHPAAAAAAGSSSCTSPLRAFSCLSCSCLPFSLLLSFTSSFLRGPHNNKERLISVFLARIPNDPSLAQCLPFHYSFAFFLDLWLWLMHSLLFLSLQQQLACSSVSLSRPPLSL